MKKKILLLLGKLSLKPFQGLKWDHKPQAFKDVQQITEERMEAICSHKKFFHKKLSFTSKHQKLCHYLPTTSTLLGNFITF